VLSTRQWWGACALLCALSVSAGVVGMRGIPLDSHEIFVAQTTHEMSLRGNWVVPYFNGEPRLNKPPLSYWAAGAMAGLAGDLPEVSAWHVRGVSLLAGLGLLACTLVLGTVVFDRITALVAGGMLVSSAGFFSFLHDARPDLLYAMWVAVMLCALAWRTYRPNTHGLSHWLTLSVLWLAFAGATLTKGPHLPGLALFGSALYLRQLHGHWRAVNQALQPLLGLAIVGLLCGSWWWALSAQVDAARVESSQLGGTLLTPALSRLGDPFYFYRPLQLVLPWIPYVLLAAGLVGTQVSVRARTGFLLYPLVVVCLGLSFGHQYRFFYVLPLLGVITLLIAAPLVAAIRQKIVTDWLFQLTAAVQIVALLACMGWVVRHAGTVLPEVIAGLLAGALCAALVAWRLWCSREFRVLAALTLMMSFVWPAAALTGALWDLERYGSHHQAALAQRALGPDTPLVTVGVSPTVYVYYSARTVPEVSLTALASLLRGSHTGTLGVVTREQHLSALTAQYSFEILDRYRRGDQDDVLLVLQEKRTP
jgi:4-amino-4-deoxy-L-arabinose transferase-like glycosyltransferase